MNSDVAESASGLPSGALVKTVIIGLGQSMRGDDGAGLAAVETWQQLYPATASRSDLRVELAGLPGLGLLGLLEGAEQVILVDAVHAGGSAGSIYILNEADLAVFTAGSGSAHGWGAAEALALGRQLNPERMPRRVILIGIEGEGFKLGESLSPAVQAALPEAARAIEQAIHSAD